MTGPTVVTGPGGGEETRFTVVLSLAHAADRADWRIRGIYTLEADAQTHLQRLQRAPDAEKTAPCIDRLTWEEIEDSIFDDRLGRLAPMITAMGICFEALQCQPR